MITPPFSIFSTLFFELCINLKDRFGCAPWKGGAFQWVKVPPGNRSSRKQPEQSWR